MRINVWTLNKINSQLLKEEEKIKKKNYLEINSFDIAK